MNSSNVPQQKDIADALMELTYDYQYIVDTTDMSKVKSDLMILQVGRDMAKFFSYRTMQNDSMLRVATSEDIMKNPARFVGGETYTLFKNHPEGKVTTIDKISLDWFRAEENIPKIDWRLTNETKEILGYVCRKAECDFGGRQWIAWFTEQIAVPIGPWKLDGLPGVVTETYDSDGHYCFKLAGVTAQVTRKITMPDALYNKTTLQKYYQTLRKYKTNPLASMQGSGVSLTIVNQEDGTPMKESDLIKEMKYDFIER